MPGEVRAVALGVALDLGAHDLDPLRVGGAARDVEEVVDEAHLAGPRAVGAPAAVARAPDIQRASGVRGIRTGEGMRHRAHEIVDLGGRLRPFERAVFGTAAAEFRGARGILWPARGTAGDEGVELSS